MVTFIQEVLGVLARKKIDLTFSGGPITSSGTLILGGTLVAANGGTGLSSYAIGDILYANTTTSLAALSPDTAGTVLSSNGPGLAPSWIAVGGTGAVTSVHVSGGTTGLTTSGGPITASGTITLGGTLLATNGGTGISAYNVGDILYAATPTTLAQLSPGIAGQFLQTQGAGVAPAWAFGGTGTVTSVGISGGTTGITITGANPITSSGTFTLSGTLAIGHGGTGITSYTQGDILYGNASGGLSKLSPGTAGQVLSTNGAGANPSWIAVGNVFSDITDYNYDVVGLRNGVNKVYKLRFNYVDNSTKVFLNGVRLTLGSQYDYDEISNDEIELAFPLLSDDLIVVDYKVNIP